MKRFLIFLLTVLILAPVQLSAQSSSSSPVEISKDKIRIDGAVYYVHQVRQGQTIVGISKAYDVSISEIEAHNPSAKGGLKVGSFIYIPVVSTSSVSSSSGKNEVKRQSVESQSGQPAEQSVVPEENVKQSKNSKQTKSEGQRYKYRRGKTETAAASAVKTTETAEEVAEAVSSAVVGTASVATVAAEGTVTEPIQTPVGNRRSLAESDKVQNATPVAPVLDEISAGIYDRDELSHTVTLVLPFGKSAGAGMSDVNHTDFYSGVLLALNDLRESPDYQKYRLDVLDMDSWDSVQDMCSRSSIGESDLIIGPISPDDMEQVSDFAREKKISVVSPLDIKTSSIARDNPYIFIYPTSSETSQRRIIDRFAEDSDGAVMIVICEKGRETSALAECAFSTMDDLGLSYTKYTYAILQNQKVGSDMMSLIPEENSIPARIFVASEDEAFVADVLRNLNVLVTTEKRNIQVYGMPKWRNFGSVQLEYLHHLKTHISLGYYLDYQSPATLDMTRRFEEIFHTSPSPYAYQGYDITRFFMESLENYGVSFPVEINGVKTSAIQSDICFVRKQDGKGFINTAVRDITYLPDWSIVLE